MSTRDHSAQDSRVTTDRSEEVLVLHGSLANAHLLVHFGGEAWHERFEQHAQSEECVEGGVDDLFATIFRFLLLVQVPGLELLEVAIALARVLHGNLETIFEFDSFHGLHVADDYRVQLVQELSIIWGHCTWIVRHGASKRACSELESSIGEVT